MYVCVCMCVCVCVCMCVCVCVCMCVLKRERERRTSPLLPLQPCVPHTVTSTQWLVQRDVCRPEAQDVALPEYFEHDQY